MNNNSKHIPGTDPKPDNGNEGKIPGGPDHTSGQDPQPDKGNDAGRRPEKPFKPANSHSLIG